MKKTELIMIMLMVCIGMAYATCTFVVPATGSTIKGDVLFNVSSITNASNCSITASSTKTGDSITAFQVKNSTSYDGGAYANATWASTNDIDSNDWVFTGVCEVNGSTYTESITSITVTIDNSVPTCTFDSALTSSNKYLPTQKWQVTGTNGTTATIKFGSNSELTMTESYINSDIFSYTGDAQIIPPGNIYGVLASISDATNTTTCSLSSIQIDSTATAKQVAAAIAGQVKKTADADAANAQVAVQQSGKSNTLLIFVVVAGAALLFINHIRRK